MCQVQNCEYYCRTSFSLGLFVWEAYGFFSLVSLFSFLINCSLHAKDSQQLFEYIRLLLISCATINSSALHLSH